MGIREHANLMDVTFTTMRDSRLAADVGQLMAAFYREESPASSFDRALFSQTIGFYLANPQRGCLVLFMDGGLLVGYALVTAIWSNEFGGMLLFVDELFVVPAARKRGIARAFFDYLKARPLFDPVALGLGVRPANGNAGDQKRIVTPAQAMTDGASILVVGRPISQSADPDLAAREIEATL